MHGDTRHNDEAARTKASNFRPSCRGKLQQADPDTIPILFIPQ